MKRLAHLVVLYVGVACPALAAELPGPAPLPAPAYVPGPPPFYSWTGYYIGANLGWDWSSINLADTAGSIFANTTSSSFLGGGQIGLNYQLGLSVLIGAEVEFDWISNAQKTITATNLTSTAAATINDRWLTTFTGRLGYVWDRVLIYGKGGGVYAGWNTPTLTVGTTPVALSGAPSNDWGWTAGFGVEWAFWGTWSVRAEYDFVSLASQTYTAATLRRSVFGGDVITVNNVDNHLITVGVNYKFNYSPR
jgi:outer membrane immunogenic protein